MSAHGSPAGRGWGSGSGRSMSDELSVVGDPARVAMVESITVQRQTMESRTQPNENAAVESIAELTYGQLKAFWDEHQALRRDTGTAFEQQNHTQLQMKAELEEQRRAVAAHQEFLQQTAMAVNQQREEIGVLKEVMSPRTRSRWGLFANTNEDFCTSQPATESAFHGTMLSAGGITGPPLYKGCTKKDKREFMDRYLSYQRRMAALSEGTGRKIALMPVGACIEHKTMVRICMYEVKKSADEMSEKDWRDYFLEAKTGNDVNLMILESAMKNLHMDVGIKDAESRVMKLLTEFHSNLEAIDMEIAVYEEPKQCIQLLCRALRPATLKIAVGRELEKQRNRSLKYNLQEFIDWLVEKVSAFLMFESSEPKLSAEAAGVKAPQKKYVGLVAKEESRNKCLKCKSTEHGVFKCPKANKEEAAKLWEAFKEARRTTKPKEKKVVGLAAGCSESDESKVIGLAAGGSESTFIHGYVQGIPIKVFLDSGADHTILSPKTWEMLNKKGAHLKRTRLDQPQRLLSFSNESMGIEEEVEFDLTLSTKEGELKLRNVKAWLSKACLPGGLGDLLVSRDIMKTLGYDQEALLTQARNVQEEYHVGGVYLPPSEEENSLKELEDLRSLPNFDMKREDEKDAVLSVLEAKMEEAKAAGASESFVEKTLTLLKNQVDVFRLVLGRDAPVDIQPMKVRLKENAVPVKSKAKRYPPEHRTFMASHLQELEAAGLVFRNAKSRWTSPPLIVKKEGAGNFRMTVDVRAVNAQTETIQWPMPMLEVIVDKLQGAKLFFSVDFFKGYWQLPLHPESQEYFSIQTDMGVYTPTRVLMGGSDSVAFCQAAVQEIFEENLYRGLLAWLDDVLGYADTEEKLFGLLEHTLRKCEERGLKLNPRKCEFYKKKVKWCGRIISEKGVEHDPKRIKGLVDMPEPQTAKELQQFICAVNWMRMSIPGYNRLMDPLHWVLEQAYVVAGGRTKTKVSRVQLHDVSWGEEETKSWRNVKEALEKAVRLAHVDPEKRVCMFTDASDKHWGAAITQVPTDQLQRAVECQDHQPLMFLSGTFSGAAERWAIIEKEAFAVIESVKRSDYLLHRGFNLFTDHRNLRYIFSPESVLASVPKYTADKLQRWSLILMGYDYCINHIAGEDNVWADLLSRWGSGLAKICALKLTKVVDSPASEKFEWPTGDEIEELPVENGKRVVTAPDLQLRLCIIAHSGAAGHQGMANTLEAVEQFFYWPDIKQDVQEFVRKCLHCSATRGGKIIPRPLGEQIHGTKPNQVLHFDFLYLHASTSGTNSVLVLKDDHSKYTWIKPCKSADARTVYEGLLEWFAAFGVCYTWVSDQGSHFKNEVVAALQHSLGAHHHFTTAYCPWANGTVEVVNRSILRVFRALLSEWRLKPEQWECCASIVQMVLNNTKLDSLAGEAPVTCMTGLPAMSALAPIAVHSSDMETKTSTIEEIQQIRQLEWKKLREAMDQLHKRVATAAKKRRGASARGKNKRKSFPNFEVGDFVLQATVAETRPKLQVVWKGPARIVGVLSQWIYEVEDLITKKVKEMHASRLKFYSDRSLEVTEALLNHIAHSQEGHEVEAFGFVRHNEATREYEVEVKWRGLDAQENSWEPIGNLLEDVPVLLKKYLKTRRNDEIVRAMVQTMNIIL